MFTIKTIRSLPPNFEEFTEENALGLRWLYGEAAEAEYRETIVQRLSATLPLDSVLTLAAFDGKRAAAMLLGVMRDATAQLSLLHVLKPYRGHGLEKALVDRAVRHYEAKCVEGITAEFVTFCDLDIHKTFLDKGFVSLDRIIMTADLPLALPESPRPVKTRPVTMRDRELVARTILDAYEEHPSRVLHTEVQSLDTATGFVRLALTGGYGPTERGYSLITMEDGEPSGAVLGCRVAPDVGFILHLAVRPPYQNRGIGSQLLGEVARHYARTGLKQIALGVTRDNPARHLYERFGFQDRHTLKAYARWRR